MMIHKSDICPNAMMNAEKNKDNQNKRKREIDRQKITPHDRE